MVPNRKRLCFDAVFHAVLEAVNSDSVKVSVEQLGCLADRPRVLQDLSYCLFVVGFLIAFHHI